MNVYRFSATAKNIKVVVAPDVATASNYVDFDWVTVKKVYDNVTIAK